MMRGFVSRGLAGLLCVLVVIVYLAFFVSVLAWICFPGIGGLASCACGCRVSSFLCLCTCVDLFPGDWRACNGGIVSDHLGINDT